MKFMRWCLLVLLSVALPVQAATAAGFGLCNRPLGHLHANPAAAKATPVTAAGQRAVVSKHGGADCSQHQQEQGLAASPSADSSDHSSDHGGCSHCSACCLGAAVPSRWQVWKAASMQQNHHGVPVAAYGAPTLRMPERPPRDCAHTT